MHKLQMYEGLRDMLEKEVTGIEKKGELDSQSLDYLYKLMTALKVTDRCIEREEKEKGMSYANRNAYDGSYGSYNQMMSSYAYDNGASMNSRGRDGDGDGRYNEQARESRDNFRYSQNRGMTYANAYGYSRDDSRKKMVKKLETLMDDTMSENERQAIMDCINKIQ